jgi:hypothetical protein
MDVCQQRLSLIDDVQALTEAREIFSGLIEQVNQVLKFIITGQLAEPDSACGGNCGSCGGCGSTDMLN